MTNTPRLEVPINPHKYSDHRVGVYSAELQTFFQHDLENPLTIDDGIAFGLALRDHPDVVLTYGYQPLTITMGKSANSSNKRRVIRLCPEGATIKHVIVHEVAHQVTDWSLNSHLSAHSSLFVGTYVDLVEFTYGDEMHQEFVHALVKRGVSFHRMRNTPGRMS